MLQIEVDDDLRLRLFQETDVEALTALALANRDTPWFDWWNSLEGNRGVVRGSLERYRQNSGFWLGVWHRSELAGAVGLDGLSAWNRSASIGYWLGREFQGRGLMTRSCRALLRHCFLKLHLNRLEIRCATQNRPSCAVAARLGFTREGTVRRAQRFDPRVHRRDDFSPTELSERAPGTGEWFFDHALYGLLRCEWDPQAGMA
ncbi:MAG: GCN5-related N-acetyltransferase [Armatimonadetes bacterium]|jgi:ribosomal-protein-serine acetyltransferase|nr:GCN5-related N-acetyltransferase [Armatimonadota bacterium]